MFQLTDFSRIYLGTKSKNSAKIPKSYP